MVREARTEDAALRRASRIVETHTATLFFLDDRVYKRKKPVRFPFLDFSTRQARQAACHREVALNSRLAPDVYLGVATDMADEGEPFVVMRRMPEERRLSSLVRTPEAFDRVRDVARVIAAFHARAATNPEIDSAGTPEALSWNWQDNFDEMRRFAGRYLDKRMLRRAEYLAGRFIAGRGPLFEQRVATGKIRDGHGDLLAEDIFCLPDGPRILDCIEFSDRLRYGDVLSDVAFLAMDLERLGRLDLAVEFLNRYGELSGEDTPDALVHFYIAYRALVRSKVACIRAEQGETRAAAKAAELLAMTVRHLERARVRLVLIGGLPGTGKTTLTHLISDDRGWAHLHSDERRKELWGLSPQTPVPATFGEGIYTREATKATYHAMIARARQIMARGDSVVLDASWTDARLRDDAAAAASTANADLVEVRCTAPQRTAAARMARRRADASDATSEIATLMAQRVDPWPSAVAIDTTGSPLTALRLLRRAVETESAPTASDASSQANAASSGH